MFKKKKEEYFWGIKKAELSKEEYMEEIHKISKYYFNASNKYKNYFFICCITRLLSTACIPIISLSIEVSWSTITISILSGIIAISESLVNISRAYEKWITYRKTLNALCNEQRCYARKAGKYSDKSNRNKIFVEECEKLIISEGIKWEKYIERSKERQ